MVAPSASSFSTRSIFVASFCWSDLTFSSDRRSFRTGFSSSQGELMQMIEFSTQSVSADSRETLLALLVLFVFALAAATYVFRKGMEKGDRTTHELLLKAVIIVTSVVPRQLPVQMAMAVNTALMALMKNGASGAARARCRG